MARQLGVRLLQGLLLLAMTYILAVNPNMLAGTGMVAGKVFTATVIASALATLLMALLLTCLLHLRLAWGLTRFLLLLLLLVWGLVEVCINCFILKDCFLFFFHFLMLVKRLLRQFLLIFEKQWLLVLVCSLR